MCYYCVGRGARGGYKPGDDIRISRLTAQAVPPSDRDVRELTRVRQIVIKRSAQSRGAFSAPVPHLCIFSNLLELSRTLFNSTPLLSLSLLIDYSFMLMLLQIPHRQKPRVKVKVKLSFQDKCIYEITPFMSVFSTSSRRTSRHAHQLNRFAFQFLSLSVQHKLIFSKNKIQNKNNYNKTKQNRDEVMEGRGTPSINTFSKGLTVHKASTAKFLPRAASSMVQIKSHHRTQRAL